MCVYSSAYKHVPMHKPYIYRRHKREEERKKIQIEMSQTSAYDNIKKLNVAREIFATALPQGEGSGEGMGVGGEHHNTNISDNKHPPSHTGSSSNGPVSPIETKLGKLHNAFQTIKATCGFNEINDIVSVFLNHKWYVTAHIYMV
jgi:hypothetical protein